MTSSPTLTSWDLGAPTSVTLEATGSDTANVATGASGDYLSCIQVVMVNTTLPANIGSAARAMHTMGLSQLTVVNPKLPIDDTSVSHAAGGGDVLSSALIVPTLEQAVANCQLIFAASSRSRHLPRPVVTPTQAAKIMLDFIDSQSTLLLSDTINDEKTNHNRPSIAILFGREDRGLTNEELSYADYHIQIDANPEYPVLNVASAIQVIASFIFAQTQSHLATLKSDVQSDEDSTDAFLLKTPLRQHWDEPAITHQQQDHLTQRIIELMIERNLADTNHLKSLPSRLSRLGSRLQLDQKEYQLLSSLVAKLLKD